MIIIESLSEKHGVELVKEDITNIMSVGISTAGTAEILMANKNPRCHIIATTLDEKGIVNTRKIIEEENLADRIEVKIEDISEKLEYDDEQFDYIYARLVLHYLDNNKLKNALSGRNRILKKDGMLYIVVRSVNAWEARLDGSSYDEETGLTKHPDLRTYGTEDVKYCYRRLHTEQSITDFLVEAGFNVEYTKVYEEHLSVDYERKNINDKASELIEVLAIK